MRMHALLFSPIGSGRPTSAGSDATTRTSTRASMGNPYHAVMAPSYPEMVIGRKTSDCKRNLSESTSAKPDEGKLAR
eukprot:scaffold336024_cov46-Prasinocladus_malaysianus.AAC.1